MSQAQDDLLRRLEALYQKRFLLLKEYPVLSVTALQFLEKDNIEDFTRKLDERDLLAGQVDPLTKEVNALMSQLSKEAQELLQAAFEPDADPATFSGRYAGLLRKISQTQKLLRNCALLDERIIGRAKASQLEIKEHLSKIRQQRMISSKYAASVSETSGVHIHYRSR